MNNENEETSSPLSVVWLLVCAFLLGAIAYAHYRDSRDEYERVIRGIRRDNLDLSTRVFMLEHPERAEELRRVMSETPLKAVIKE